jgi:hypothetical protein
VTPEPETPPRGHSVRGSGSALTGAAPYGHVKLEQVSHPAAMHDMPTSQRQPRGAQEQDYVARVLDASPPQAIKAVLLHLTTLSPALSEALVRGLTSEQQRQTAVSRPRLNPGFGDGSGQGGHHPSASSFSRPPPIKYERNISSGTSSSRSHTAFPNPNSANSTPPHQDFTGSRPRSPTSSSKTLSCRNCHQSFVEGSEGTCWYHPGRKRMVPDITGQKVPTYTCCNQDDLSPPCVNGTHVAIATSGLDLLKRPLQRDGASGYFDQGRQSPRLR